MCFRIDRMWVKKRRETILLFAFPKGYRQVTIRPTSIEQPTPYWREPLVCLFSVVENLAIFLGTRTKVKSPILLICYNSVFLERKRNDGFVSHSAADSVCFWFLSYVLVRPCILFVSRCRDAGVNTCSCLLCVADIAMLEYTSKDSLFISNVQRNGQKFSSSAPILIFAAILLLLCLY